jgi:hypothetical protein
MAKPTEVTLAIREALQVLNDADATSDEIRAKILERHPELEKQLRGGRFSQSVSRARVRLREGEPDSDGKPAPVTRRRREKKPQRSTYDLYRMAQDFWERLGGNTQLADQILRYLEETDIAELRRAWEGWKQLVATAGGQQNARRILEIQKQTGMIQ